MLRTAAETVAFHRDPLGVLKRLRAREGPVFTIDLAVLGPVVVVADPAAIGPLMAADPDRAHAGEARRRVLPFASDRSMFGADGEQHARTRRHIADAFAAPRIAGLRGDMARIAEEHAARWPRGRPFRLLPRVRTLIDAFFVRHVLGVRDEERARLAVLALRRMLQSPGNPPMPLPGPGNQTLERPVSALFAWRAGPLRAVLGQEIDARRARPEGDDVIGHLVRSAPEQDAAAMTDELLSVIMAAQEPPSVAVTRLLERAARGADIADEGVVRETLRLTPPALGVLRTLTEPMEVAGRQIPAGAVTMLPIPLLQRDPAAFPEPDAFRPERWADGAREDCFLPFGGGARRCVGEALAQAYFGAIAPVLAGTLALKPLSRAPERMVVRATTLVPQRSGLVTARARS